MKIDLSKVNLNLLVAFAALMQERHVTKAGQRLYLSQSAMSNTLKQLRALFQDELFIRGQSSRMLPTARALALAEPIQEIIEKIDSIFQPTEAFDPAKAQATFTIGMSDYTEFVLLPLLAKLLIEKAPGINLVIKNINYIKDASIFEQDEIDLAIGIYSKIPDKLIARKLWTEKAVCVGWNKNPLLKSPITLEELATAKQLVVLYYENRSELFTEQYLKKLGIKRHAVITAPNTLTALQSLAHTPLICIVLERIARIFAKNMPLAIQPVPFPYPKIEVNMCWHSKHQHNPVHRWLRENIIASKILCNV